jgi:uncharacterized protein DUF5681
MSGDSQHNQQLSAVQPENTATARGAGGRWLPGKSGNPGGRPKTAVSLRDLAREHAADAIARLVEALDAMRPVGLEGDEIPDHDVRIRAANALLDRGYGKPKEHIELADTREYSAVFDRIEALRQSDKGAHLLAVAEALASQQEQPKS